MCDICTDAVEVNNLHLFKGSYRHKKNADSSRNPINIIAALKHSFENVGSIQLSSKPKRNKSFTARKGTTKRKKR